jgi:RsiW-degrading membrane proteinase PrsW (M82 family)
MTWADIRSFLESWFLYPGIAWHLILIAVAMALFFGIIWMIFHQPRIRDNWPLAVMVFSAFFTVVITAVVQIPLQYYLEKGMVNLWGRLTLNDWLLLAGIPTILISGLVQEGAKMVPMVAWWRGRKNLDPKTGLVIGALAGFGFGVFEGFCVNAYFLGSGWTWDTIINNGFIGIAPYWERFFTIGFHIAVSAIAGYGLAKGRGWQFYLIAAGLHSLVNYGSLIYQKGHLTVTQVEIYIAVVAVLVIVAALWLRWRKEKGGEITQPGEPAEPVEPVEPAQTDV